MLTSPLQLAVMTARLASGKAVTPTLLRNPENLGLEQTPREAEPLGIPEEHLQLVRSGMDAVTNDRKGTAYRARIDIEGMEMAGKTGTSQVRRITMAERAAGVTKNEDLPWRRRDHALFVAFAPVEKPRYACAVVVEHGGGGSKAAAPIARDILIETQRRDPLKDRADEQLAEALRDS
jgi:penicillin-binding protein 2